MLNRILTLQEKQENIANIKLALYDCEIVVVHKIEKALDALRDQGSFQLIIAAVHLEHDDSVFDFLKVAKANPWTRDIPFVFYCSESSSFARSVRDGLQIAARALGADKYVTMETFDCAILRRELSDFLPQSELSAVGAGPSSVGLVELSDNDIGNSHRPPAV